MSNFQGKFRSYLERRGIPFTDNTDEFSFPDFHLDLSGKSLWVELKEKSKPYIPAKWSIDPDEREEVFFICDDLSLRKVMYRPNSVLLICDHPRRTMILYTSLDLLYAPKRRGNRVLEYNNGPAGPATVYKGKVLLNTSIGGIFRSRHFSEIEEEMKEYAIKVKNAYNESTECYNREDEELPFWGTPRSNELRNKDVHTFGEG